jgi:predicted dehydrogenase
MAGKIRLGFVGANIHSDWANKSHFPALRASPDIELTAVCTTNPQSAEEAREAFGARLAFSDYRVMANSPEIDAVAVVVRAPSHYAPTMAALGGGKHVYTEWPLGVTTREAEDMAGLARANNLFTAIGLQSRVNPAMLHMKELVAAGYVGKVLTCRATAIRVGHLERPAHRSWFADEKQGATPLTIMTSHIADSLRFVAGDFVQLSAQVSRQIKQWRVRETGAMIDVTAPDNIMLHGQLANGAVAAVQVATVPYAPAGYLMEVYGTEGKLTISSKVSSNHGEQNEMLKLQGAQKSNQLQDIETPDRFFFLPPEFPRGTPFPIGQMYALLAKAIRTGQAPAELPSFDTALQVHRLLDVIRQSSDSGARVTVPVS